jgi:hypothetical protein
MAYRLGAAATILGIALGIAGAVLQRVSLLIIGFIVMVVAFVAIAFELY